MMRRSASVTANLAAGQTHIVKRLRHARAGPVGRAGVSGIQATVFGAYGFIGRYVVELLASQGTRCIVPYRGDDMEWRHLKVLGELGMVTPVPFSPRDEATMRRAIGQSDVVINLIGKDYETTHYLPWLKNYTFEDTHVTIPETIGKLCIEHDVKNLIHVSALSANKKSVSAWSRSKAFGEEALRAACPGATIVRPADMFGEEDRFLNTIARIYQRFPRLPLINGGESKVQPLYVMDAAHAIAKIATSTDPDVFLAQTYDLAGPEVYTYREVVEFVFEAIHAKEPHVANLSPVLAELMGTVVGAFPNPLIHSELFVRQKEDAILNPASTAKRLHDLGIEATSMELPRFHFLSMYHSGTHFDRPTGGAPTQA